MSEYHQLILEVASLAIISYWLGLLTGWRIRK
jgi:hypothetical protein